MTRDEILVELKNRGVDPSNPSTYEETPSLTPEQIRTELRRRGIDPDEKDSALKGIASGALQTVAAPFQAAGEFMRTGGVLGMLERVYQGQPVMGDAVAPSIVQRMVPSTQSDRQPVDPATLAESGLKGLLPLIQNLRAGQGSMSEAIQKGAENVEQAQQKPTVKDMIAQMVIALGSGEVGNLPMKAITGPLGKAAEALTPEFANLTKAANPEIAQAAKKAKVSLTASGLTGSKTQAQIENFFSSLPFSSDVMQGNFKAQLENVKNVRGPLIAEAKVPAQLGQDIQSSIEKSSKGAFSNAQGLYQNAASSLAEGQKIPASNLEKKAQEIFDLQSKLPPASRVKGSMDLLNQFKPQASADQDVNSLLGRASNPTERQNLINQIKAQGGSVTEGPKEFDYNTLQGIRGDLNYRIAQEDAALGTATRGLKGVSSPEGGVYKQLKSALDKDLSDFSAQQGGFFKQAFDQANQNYSEFKQTFKNNKFIQSLVRDQNPENVVDKVSKAVIDDPKALETLQKVLPKPLLEDVKSAFIKDMSESKPDEFSPTHFVTRYERIGEDKLNQFLGPDIVQKLHPLYLLSKASTNAERIAGNPSGTSQRMASIIGMSAPLMTALRGHPLTALGMGLLEMKGLPAAAKIYLSKPVTNFLSRQPTGLSDMVNRVTGQIPTLAKTAAPAANPQAQQNLADLIQKLKDKYDQRRQF